MANHKLYDDFVNSMTRWMGRDNNIRSRVLDQLNEKPDSTTSDILKVLCDYLGIGEPIELVDDEDESVFNVGSMRAIG